MPNSVSFTQLRGYFFVLITVVVWAAFPLFSRYATSHTALTAWDLGFIRFTTGALVLLPFALWKYQLQWLRHYRFWVLAGLGGVGYACTAFYGFSKAPATHAAIWLHGFLPVWTVVVSHFAFKQPVSKHNVVSVAVIIVGIIFMNVTMLMHGRWSFSIGDAFFVLASFFWALYAGFLLHWRYSPILATSAVTLISALVYSPLYIASGQFAHLSTVPWLILAEQAVFQGVIVVIIAMLTYMAAIRLLGALTSGIFLSFAPMLTALLAWAYLNEHLRSETLIGIASVSIAALQPWRLWKKNYHN